MGTSASSANFNECSLFELSCAKLVEGGSVRTIIGSDLLLSRCLVSLFSKAERTPYCSFALSFEGIEGLFVGERVGLIPIACLPVFSPPTVGISAISKLGIGGRAIVVVTVCGRI